MISWSSELLTEVWRIDSMAQQVYSAPSPDPGDGDVEEPGNVSRIYGDGLFPAVTLRGRPVDNSRTGRMRAAVHMYALTLADFTATISITTALLFYLYSYMYQSISDSATIANNYTGSTLLLAVLGSFIADSFLGHYYTIVIGGIIEMLGLGVMVLSVVDSGLQPPPCTRTLTTDCPPAGAKYMAPIYVALYTIALGSGLIKAGIPALGAEQFDESDPVEKDQSVRYFIGYYLFENLGLFLSFSLSVYILSYVSKNWGFIWLLIFFVVMFLLFLAGTPKFRHKRPGGSFITRIVQVFVCVISKRNLHIPEDTAKLYDAPVSGGWLKRSTNLRFLDKACVIGNEEEKGNPWRVVGVSQVEETKRILLILPIWLCTWYVSLLFSQVTTFTATQGETLNRSLSEHFVIPPQSLGAALVLISIVAVPIYEMFFRPILRKITGNPYGLAPLTRIGIGIISASMGMIVAALVERKRLGYVRHRGYENLPFFELPMKMYWLLPQYFFTSLAELFFVVSIYEFFYHEVSDNTRSIGTSFSFSAISMGYYFSSVLVDTTNSVTQHYKGGRWLVERLNNGGLENYYWLLASILAVNFLIYLVVVYFYSYNYPGYLSPKQAARIKRLEITTDPATDDL